MTNNKKTSLQEEAISNIKQDRTVIRAFLISIFEQINNRTGAEAKELHQDLGEVFAKYILASVKNNEQMIEIIKMLGKEEENAKNKEKFTEEDVENLYHQLDQQIQKKQLD